MAKSNGHTASMNRSFISSWIKTALPTISTYSMTSFASGRTTTITIDRTEPSMGRPHTSGSWQKPLPVCHLRLETLHVGNGAVEWIRTTDLLITNQLLYQLSYNSDVAIITAAGFPFEGMSRGKTGRTGQFTRRQRRSRPGTGASVGPFRPLVGKPLAAPPGA